MSLNYIERLLLQLEEDVTRLVRDQLLGIEGTNMPMGVPVFSIPSSWARTKRVTSSSSCKSRRSM